MKLRYFYKIDHNRQPIAGSNVRRKSKPGKQWREIQDPCCSPSDIACSCGPRFFVQLDGLGKPVDGTLIKRKQHPEPIDNIRYMEIASSESECCVPITWSYTNQTQGRLLIKANNKVVVDSLITTTGKYIPNVGDKIHITLTNLSIGSQTSFLQVMDDDTNEVLFTSTDTPVIDYIFTFTNRYTVITADTND